MQIPHEALALATRSVSTVEVAGQPARRTVMTRSFPTDQADLWEAVTSPDRIPRWFLPITGDLTPGGSYQLQGHAGGTIEECVAPQRFRVTWGGEDSWVTVTLAPEPGGSTLLELEHVAVVPEDFWTRFGPSATGIGWDMMFLGLGLHVITGETIDQAEATAWAMSPEGVAMTERSGSLWQEADVAGGTDPEDAATRSAYTVAVYTGKAEPPQQ